MYQNPNEHNSEHNSNTIVSIESEEKEYFWERYLSHDQRGY